MKNLREIIAVTAAVSIIFLAGCSNLNYIRFLFLDRETKEGVRKLQEVSRNIKQGTPGYYSEENSLSPQSRDYQERIHSLPSEEVNREIWRLYLGK